MLEFILCSMLTIFPDFLFRRFVQGKKWGRELNLFSVWYELRWGLTSCAILTVSLITLIFYYHPTTTNVSSFFRTVTILSESGGRVEKVFVASNQRVEAGAALFEFDSSRQKAAVEAAERRVAEVNAALIVAQSEALAASGAVDQARAAHQQATAELQRKATLLKKSKNIVSAQEIERLETEVKTKQGALSAAIANKQAVDAKIATLLPAQKASAQTAVEQAEIELSKTVIYAGVAGTVQQFALQPGDYVNPILRPAGILVPADSGKNRFQAGFGQISAQVIKPGMIAEITCISKPFEIIPMVVEQVQNVIAAGQMRPTDQLIDIQERARPGTLSVIMVPLYAGQAHDIPAGSKCIANAYTSNHEALASGNLSTSKWLLYHVIDTVGLAHALILRIQALLLPVQILVFSGH